MPSESHPLPWTLFRMARFWAIAASLAASSPATANDFFEARIRPVLAEHCQSCHGAEKQKADLRLDSRAFLLKGGESGPAIVPGNPESSLLLKAISHSDPDLAMVDPSRFGPLDSPVLRGLRLPPDLLRVLYRDAAIALFGD